MERQPGATPVRQRMAQELVRADPPGAVRLSLVVPAYEEAARIGRAVERIHQELGPLVGSGELEVVVVDDGSSDVTAEAARSAGAERVVVQPVNRGKGAAVRAGMEVACGRTVAFTDADLAYAPAQVFSLLQQVEEGWDVVMGSRRHADTTTVVAAPRLRRLGGRVINAATRLVLDGAYADTQCGLKAFRSDVAAVLFRRGRINGCAFDVELLLMAERYGFSITEVPVIIENTERSTIHVARDAGGMLVEFVRIRGAAHRGAYGIGRCEPTGVR